MCNKGIIRFLLFFLCIANIQIGLAQKETVINNKGTKIDVINNQVTTSDVEPTDPSNTSGPPGLPPDPTVPTETTYPPEIGDVWFDNSDPNNILTNIYDGTEWVLLNVNDADSDITNEIQDLTSAILSGNILTISIDNGDPVSVDLSTLINDADFDITNEIQDLTLSGNILTITNNGTATDIDLSTYLDNTDAQTIGLAGNTITLANGTGADTTVDLTGYINTDDQNLTSAVVTANKTVEIQITDGTNTTINIQDADFDITNEINTAFSVVEISGTKYLRITDSGGNKDIPLSDLEHTGTTGSVFFAGADGKPTENNDQLFWDDTNKRLYVGGNVSGTNKLNVDGTTRTSGLNNSNGTVGQPSYRFTGDSDTGMYRSDDNQLSFATAGVEAIRIEATQQVNVTDNLSVVGSYLDSNGESGTSGQVLSSTVTGTDWVDASTDSQTLSITGDQLTISGGNTVTIPQSESTLTVTKETIGYVFAAAHTLGDGTNSFNINCTVSKTGTGRYTVSFDPANPHPNGANYDISFGTQVNSDRRDSRIASVVEGSQDASGFDVIVVTSDNGITADTYVDEVWYFNTSATKEVVTNVTQTTTTSTPTTGTATTPLGTLDTSSILVYNLQDNAGPFHIEFGNRTSEDVNYELLLSNVPYSTIPNLVAGNYTVSTSNNADGSYNHLFRSTAPLEQWATIDIRGDLPSPIGYTNGGQPTSPTTITFYTR